MVIIIFSHADSCTRRFAIVLFHTVLAVTVSKAAIIPCMQFPDMLLQFRSHIGILLILLHVLFIVFLDPLLINDKTKPKHLEGQAEKDEAEQRMLYVTKCYAEVIKERRKFLAA